MSSDDPRPFSLQDISNAALDIGVQQWTPAPVVTRAAGMQGALLCLAVAAASILLCYLPGMSRPDPASVGFTLAEATAQGTYFYVILREPSAEDLVTLSALRARGANVTLASERAPTEVQHFAAQSGSIGTEGVIVDGAQWRPLSPR